MANILNYTMTYKDKIFTKELYDNESEEFQKIALETQKVGSRLVYVRQIKKNCFNCNVKEEIN